ncbi:tRNA uridine 5-carboxymethylaminomethyl modification enzyme MnmG [Gossypium arboreum]|uniref:Uncharacterized protein n=2 Tax=Gossypium arboreum TaxID=29729 RepID=A0ABR0NEY0_GOSAR|nr:hypothetical protein PVK06_033933 [Gossypium arboreum]KHG26576.1 tRNA uridine 5-carboxymethylaminomethyl modification enzyme MnmG [Gossypium arboreum]
MIAFHLANRRRANIGLMADDMRLTTQPLPVKIAIMEIWLNCTEKMTRGSRVDNHPSGILPVYSRSCC